MILLGVTDSIRMSAMDLPVHTGTSYAPCRAFPGAGAVLAASFEVFGVTRLNRPERQKSWRRPPPAVPRRLFGADFAAAPKRRGPSGGALQ